MISIRENELVQAFKISNRIPEFDNPYKLNEYGHRTIGVMHLILTIIYNNEIVGFKIGYDRFQNDSFYSWMGGILPEYRRKGLANALANFQEEWARGNGYHKIKMKTMSKHKAMISFSLNRGFKIASKIAKKSLDGSRIWMEKIL
tara:strand:+ start:28 stop:462 length:435 start_codon:yes stop_codon:yes gene_type:complete